MKIQPLVAALLASAALIVPVQGGNGHHGNGGGNAGGVRSAPARSGGVSSYRAMGRFSGGPAFRSMPVRTFSANRTIYSGQRFSSPVYSSKPMEFRSHINNSNFGASSTGRQFARTDSIRNDRLNGLSNNRNQGVANLGHQGKGQLQNGQLRNGNARLRPDWQKHVFAQHSANWQRNWDRHSDHWWNGHRCHFFNGSWVIFDVGFYPWWGPWGYPYDYGYGYYPYGYGYGYGPSDYGYGYNYGYGSNTDSYDDQNTYDQNGYGQNSYSDESANSTVAAVQDRLSSQGYYHGQIDGVIGPETRRALARFQNNRGLRGSGELTTETLNALGLRQYASY